MIKVKVDKIKTNEYYLYNVNIFIKYKNKKISFVLEDIYS